MVDIRLRKMVRTLALGLCAALALLAGPTEVSAQSTDHAAKVVATLKEKAAAGDTLALLKLGLIDRRGASSGTQAVCPSSSWSGPR